MATVYDYDDEQLRDLDEGFLLQQRRSKQKRECEQVSRQSQCQASNIAASLHRSLRLTFFFFFAASSCFWSISLLALSCSDSRYTPVSSSTVPPISREDCNEASGRNEEDEPGS